MKAHDGEAQVGIIGAGVMGLSTAFHLAEQGQDVLVLDKSVAGLQASGANAGTLAVQNKRLEAIPLVLRSLDIWETLSDRLGADVVFESRGGFRVAHSEEDVENLERTVHDQRLQGAELEVVYPPQLHTEAPYLAHDIKAASYCPRDAMADPFATTRAFLNAIGRLGARLWQNCPVTRIEINGDYDFTLHTERGVVHCRNVVVASGAWILEVASMLGLDLPLRARIQQVSISAPFPPLFPHIITHTRGRLTVKQQNKSGKVILGGGWPGDGDLRTGTKEVSRASLVDNWRWAAQTIPGLTELQLLRSWVGFEGRTPDKLMISGRLGPAGLSVIGCAAGGFTLAPIAGKIAADYVINGESGIPDRRFIVERFRGESID